MDKLKLALVGCGNVGQVVHLPILLKMPDVEVLAVVDPDRRKAQAVALRNNIPHSFARVEDLLDSPVGKEIEVVDVCSSTDAHKPVAVAALEAGKDVLVEKPIARTAKEAKEIVDAAAKHGRKLMV